MAKKSRSKQKKRGSQSGCKIITQDSDREILNEIVTQDSCQIITQDSDNAITTQDSDNQVTRDSESLSFDCFNEDGILSLILSKLSLKEAVSTCVLSRRWNHVWRNLPVLNFNVENIFDEETLERYETIEHYDSFLTEVDKFILLLVENWSKCSPNFIHLKLLDWAWSDGVKMSHLHLYTLLDAAPFLEELKLRLSNCGVEEPRPRLTKLKKTLPKHPHPHLKTIEISGFSFLRWQVEIVLYLLINATKLESMTLMLEKGPESVKNADMKSLAQQVPPYVKLVIL